MHPKRSLPQLVRDDCCNKHNNIIMFLVEHELDTNTAASFIHCYTRDIHSFMGKIN